MAEDVIIQKLNHIEKLLYEQSLLQKEVLNFNEASKYLDTSQSHLYKLTSTKQIPHFCPQGKRLYFKRSELDTWLLRNRKKSNDEIELAAAKYITITSRRR